MFDFSGHGSAAMPDGPFSIELFAADALQYMNERQIDKVCVFGYSMGGYVAMYLAKQYPEKISKVITLATKWHWDEDTAAKEIQMLNPEKIAHKLPAFAATLVQRHAPNDWKDVLQKTTEMMIALGKDNTLKVDDHAAINIPVLLMLGDRDKMVSLDETLAVYKTLPAAQLAVLPGTPHPIEQTDAALLAFYINRSVNS